MDTTDYHFVVTRTLDNCTNIADEIVVIVPQYEHIFDVNFATFVKEVVEYVNAYGSKSI